MAVLVFMHLFYDIFVEAEVSCRIVMCAYLLVSYCVLLSPFLPPPAVQRMMMALMC